MTTKEKNEIAERLENIELEAFSMYYEAEMEQDGDFDFDEAKDSIEKDVKFIREKLNIPTPILDSN